MALGLLASWNLSASSTAFVSWQMGFLAFVLLGAVDDRLHLRAGSKFLFQAFVAAAVIVASGLGLPSLGEVLPGWEPSLGWLAVPFSVLAISSVMNAVNMSDGVDGLAGSLMLVAFAGLSGASILVDRPDTAVLGLASVAVLLAFLVFNLRGLSGRPARLFMGDAGSLGMGFLLAALSLKVASPDTGVPPVVVLWFCLVPLADGLSVIVSRLARRSGATEPGRDHFHHLLLARGLSPGGVVAVETGGAVMFALGAIVGWRAGLPEWVLASAFAGTLAVFHVSVARSWAAIRGETTGRRVDFRAPDDAVPAERGTR